MTLENFFNWVGLLIPGIIINFFIFLFLNKIKLKNGAKLLLLFLIPILVLLFSIYGIGGWEGFTIGIVTLGMFLFSIIFAISSLIKSLTRK